MLNTTRVRHKCVLSLNGIGGGGESWSVVQEKNRGISMPIMQIWSNRRNAKDAAEALVGLWKNSPGDRAEEDDAE